MIILQFMPMKALYLYIREVHLNTKFSTGTESEQG